MALTPAGSLIREVLEHLGPVVRMPEATGIDLPDVLVALGCRAWRSEDRLRVMVSYPDGRLDFVTAGEHTFVTKHLPREEDTVDYDSCLAFVQRSMLDHADGLADELVRSGADVPPPADKEWN